MLKISVKVGEPARRVLASYQFHVRYGEPFLLEFGEAGEKFAIRFEQEIEEPKLSLLPFKQQATEPQIEIDAASTSEEIRYVLINFNQTKVTTNTIPIFTHTQYSFQITAISINDEVNNPETIWLYTITIYGGTDEQKG